MKNTVIRLIKKSSTIGSRITCEMLGHVTEQGVTEQSYRLFAKIKRMLRKCVAYGNWHI